VVNYLDNAVVLGTTYTYRVKAVNGPYSSAYSNLATAIVAIPGAPANFNVTVVRNGTTDLATLTWTPVAPLNQASFTIQRATNAAFTQGLTTVSVAANDNLPDTESYSRSLLLLPDSIDECPWIFHLGECKCVPDCGSVNRNFQNQLLAGSGKRLRLRESMARRSIPQRERTAALTISIIPSKY